MLVRGRLKEPRRKEKMDKGVEGRLTLVSFLTAPEAEEPGRLDISCLSGAKKSKTRSLMFEPLRDRPAGLAVDVETDAAGGVPAVVGDGGAKNSPMALRPLPARETSDPFLDPARGLSIATLDGASLAPVFGP